MPSETDTHQSIYKTRELSMAAYLSMNGYLFDLQRDGQSKSGHPIGSWVFRDRDGGLGERVQEYNNNEARVEPSKYLREVNNCRKALFRFLGIKKQPPPEQSTE